MRIAILLLFISNFCFSQETEVFNFKYYSVEYDFDKRSANSVSYSLTNEMVSDTSKSTERVGFIATKKTASNKDYRKSGYDRGHCFPHAHSSHDSDFAHQSMYFVNIVAQTPYINRGLWKQIEEYERHLAVKYGCIRVKIDIVYSREKMKRVFLPDHFIKRIETCFGESLGEFRIENIN